METQKTPNNQKNLEKKDSWRNHTLGFQTIVKLQSSKQYGTGTKSDT